MDVLKIKKELLKAARGKKSQLQLSQRLGFKFNQVYRWEAGLTRIHWKEFIHLCEICKIDIKKILKESLAFQGDLTRTEGIIQHIIGSQKIASLAKLTGISRFSISDWSKGNSEPPLDAVLKLMQNRDLLMSFLEAFPGVEIGPDLDQKIKSKKAARNFFYDNPLASAAWICLDLTEYQGTSKHIPGFIARHIGVSLAEEKNMLDQMEKLGLVILENGKYKKNELNFNTRGDFEAEKKLRTFWVERGLQTDLSRDRQTDKENFGYIIFAADKKKRKMILEAYRQYINHLYTICNLESEKDDEVMVMTMQLFGASKGK